VPPPQAALVTLRVYNLGKSSEVRHINRILRALGTGAFHCGVEVYGREWSYRGNSSSATGVFSCRPCECDRHSYYESMPMGSTTLSEDDVLLLVKQLEKEWLGTYYNVLTHNCCHFSELFCRCLGVADIPPWLTNLADTGAAIADGLEHIQNAISQEYYDLSSAATCKPVENCCSRARARREDNSETLEGPTHGPVCDDDEDIVPVGLADKSARRRQSAVLIGPATPFHPRTGQSFLSNRGRLLVFL